MSDGYSTEGGVKRCNGCTRHHTTQSLFGGTFHECHHTKAPNGPPVQIGYTDRTPRWCPLDAQSTETTP